MGFSVSPVAAGEFFRASAVPSLKAAPKAQKKSPLIAGLKIHHHSGKLRFWIASNRTILHNYDQEETKSFCGGIIKLQKIYTPFFGR
jgi:hypothetical protein